MKAHDPNLICNGKYRLIAIAGKGSYGTVWRAEELNRHGRVVAIVAIKMARPGDQETEVRFEHELILSRKIDHPNLLCANTTENHGDVQMLVLPFAEGGSLRERLGNGPLPIDEAVRIAIAIANALGYLHNHKSDVIHRDVHPGNILFKDGMPKLTDLGQAQSRDFSTSLWYGKHKDRHPGNIFYQPPEAFAKPNQSILPLDPQADVFMLGAVLWEMLTDTGYYRNKGNRPSSLRAGIPQWLDDLVMEMLNEDYRQRPRNGAKAAELLQAGYDVWQREEQLRLAEGLAKQQAEQIAREKAEQDRLAREKAEAQRLERERLERERLAREKAEQERIAKEKVEQERLAKAKAEAERVAYEKAKQERIAKVKAEAERLAYVKAEQERIAKDKAEAERLAHAKAEQERIAKAKAEAERLAREKATQERVAKEKAEAARLVREKLERERLDREKAQRETLARERAERERLAREKREQKLKELRAKIQKLIVRLAHVDALWWPFTILTILLGIVMSFTTATVFGYIRETQTARAIAVVPTSTLTPTVIPAMTATLVPTFTLSHTPTLTITPTNTATASPTNTLVPPTKTLIPFTPIPATPSKRVVRVYEQKGGETNDYEIYVAYSDGSIVQLTNNAVDDRYPLLSPNGSRIAYVSFVDGDSFLYLMNVDGAELRKIMSIWVYSPNLVADHDKCWLPDGTQLIFARYYGNVYSVRADGSEIVRLLPFLEFGLISGVYYLGECLPDGRIKYSRYSRSGSTNYVMNADGSNKELYKP